MSDESLPPIDLFREIALIALGAQPQNRAFPCINSPPQVRLRRLNPQTVVNARESCRIAFESSLTEMELVPRRSSAPANFKDNYYIYIPNLPAAIVALVLWFIILIVIVYRSWRYRIWYLTILVVGLVSIPYLYDLICSGTDWVCYASIWPLSLE
jgi:hypothetical protein